MSRHTKTTEYTQCDIPGCKEKRTADQGEPFEIVNISGSDWDICRNCYLSARPVIVFLADVVGLDLRLGSREKGKTADEIMRY